jgi:DmsE family decaheme c-type cytochrome
VAACVASWTPPPETARYHRTAAIPGAEIVGAEECTVCHDEVHGRALAPDYHADCEACHGPGGEHADSEEITDIRFPAASDCLACHETGRSGHLSWSTSEHARAGVLCSDCHATHNREPYHVRQSHSVGFRQATPSTSMCISCHPGVASQLSLPSHHPVREGMMDCVSCHEPHGDRRTRLGVPTELCASCHQDHAGPWIFEHPPVAEDCGYCHNPHGSAAYDLLETNQPSICISCHSTPDTAHLETSEGLGIGDPITDAVAAAFYTRCTDCHGAIHGSYQDPHLRR